MCKQLFCRRGKKRLYKNYLLLKENKGPYYLRVNDTQSNFML
jgi:hypothetical protein